jgi:hypothetical protein
MRMRTAALLRTHALYTLPIVHPLFYTITYAMLLLLRTHTLSRLYPHHVRSASSTQTTMQCQTPSGRR